MTTFEFLRYLTKDSPIIHIEYVYFGVSYQPNDLVDKLNAENRFKGVKINDLFERTKNDDALMELLSNKVSCFSMMEEGQVFVQC